MATTTAAKSALRAASPPPPESPPPVLGTGEGAAEQPSFRELALQLAEEHERRLQAATEAAAAAARAEATGGAARRQESTGKQPKTVRLPSKPEIVEFPMLPNQVGESDGKEQSSSWAEDSDDGFGESDEDDMEILSPKTKAKAILMRSVNSRALVSYKLRQEWMPQENKYGRQRSSSSVYDATTPMKMKLESDDSQTKVPQETHDGVISRFISFPNTPPRVAWDLVGAFLILWDLIFIPMKVFDPPQSTFTAFADWVTLLFWTANIFASLTVGFVSDGVIVMVPSKIFINYLQTWCIVDLIVVVPDWIFTILSVMGSGSGAGSSVKMLRALRLVRAVRILRLLKLKRLLSAVNDHLDSEYATICANIVKMIMILCAINHFIACAWWAVGLVNREESWIRHHGYEDVDWGYQYWTSFHWSITQFTPSSMSVQPQNIVERFFAVLIVIFALVGFSYLVGSITGSLTQLRGMQEEYAKQFWNLRRYMRKNNVPLALNFRIQRYLEHAWHQQKDNVSASNLKVLALLSEQLNNELQCTMSVPHMTVHPLFSHLERVSTQEGVEITLQRLATKAISRKLLARGDSLFIPGEVGTHMYFVVAGHLQYARYLHQDVVMEGEAWVAEPVLWVTEWTHVGALIAAVEADMMLVDGSRFVEIVSLNPQVYRDLTAYASRFLDWANSRASDELTDIFHSKDVSSELETFVEGYEQQSMAERKSSISRRRRGSC